MKNKYLENASITLDCLDKVEKLIAKDEDYSEYYFRTQLLRYYQTLMIAFEYLSPGRALDIGSYPSHLHKALLMMGYDLFGVDIDPTRICSNLSDCKVATFQVDIESPNWRINVDQFDIIFFLEVIEHLHVNPFVVFHEIESLLKKGGHIFLSTPNLFALKNRKNFIQGKYVFEHPLSVYEKLERHNSRGHQRLYSVEELEDILDVYGFDVVNKWCLNESSPMLDRKKIAEFLSVDFNFDKFSAFWRDSVSWKGKIRLRIERILNNYFSNYYSTIYIIARKNRSYDKNKVIEKIKKSDPWVSVGKFQLK